MPHRRQFIPNQNPNLRPMVSRVHKDATLNCGFCRQSFTGAEVTVITRRNLNGEVNADPRCPKCHARFYRIEGGDARTGRTSAELNPPDSPEAA